METEAFLETLYGEKHVPFASSLDCVKLTGLPYSATADDVVNFFNELADDIKTSGIHMVLNTQVSVMATFESIWCGVFYLFLVDFSFYMPFSNLCGCNYVTILFTAHQDCQSY